MNQAPPSPQYLVHTGEPLRDRDTVLSIWWGNLGRTDRIAAKYDWFYLSGPHGPPLLQLLQETTTGQWVGTACAGRRRMRHRGRELSAGVPVLNPSGGGVGWLLGRTGFETDAVVDARGRFRPDWLALYLFRKPVRRLA